MMRPTVDGLPTQPETEVESGCRRLAWAVLWAPRRSPRPDMFQPLCSEVGARTVDGLPTQPEAVLGRRGLPARLLSRRCVPRAACVALRGPLLPRPRRRSPSPCAAGSLRLAISCAPRLRRAALRPGPCWASRPTRRAYAGSSSAALAAWPRRGGPPPLRARRSRGGGAAAPPPRSPPPRGRAPLRGAALPAGPASPLVSDRPRAFWYLFGICIQPFYICCTMIQKLNSCNYEPTTWQAQQLEALQNILTDRVVV